MQREGKTLSHRKAIDATHPGPRRTVRPSRRGEPPLPGADRRQRKRRSIRCECWLDRETTSLYTAEADVSRGQLFFRTGVPIMPGEQVRVSLDFADGSEPVLAQGIVTEIVEASRGQRNGVGVSLSKILEGDDELERHLRQG
jgi:hypothetical protein